MNFIFRYNAQNSSTLWMTKFFFIVQKFSQRKYLLPQKFPKCKKNTHTKKTMKKCRLYTDIKFPSIWKGIRAFIYLLFQAISFKILFVSIDLADHAKKKNKSSKRSAKKWLQLNKSSAARTEYKAHTRPSTLT